MKTLVTSSADTIVEPTAPSRADIGVTLPPRLTRRVPDQLPPTRKPMNQPPIATAVHQVPDDIADIDRGRAEDRHRFMQQLSRAMGPLLNILDEENVSDIHRNPDGSVLIDRVGVGTTGLDYRFSDDGAMQIIALVARHMGARCDEKNPLLEGVLPNGSRFSASVPPAVRPGPMFTIRKHAILVRTFEDYLEKGIMTREQALLLRKRINLRDNFLVVGSTGSGKTTLANAILREASENSTLADRFIILEDAAELQCPAPNTVALLTVPSLGITMNSLLEASLRYKPTRICVGELRGKEAATYVEACNTGHDGGLATIHSESAESALIRLELLVKKGGMEPNRREIMRAVNTVVVIKYVAAEGRRRITEVKRVTSANESEYFFTNA